MINVIILLIVSFILIFIIRLLYFILTIKEKKIKVLQKFKLTVNNKTIFKIFDENKIEYIISEDLFTSKLKCQILWDILNENNFYNVLVYGFNVPILDINYRIINIKKN